MENERNEGFRQRGLYDPAFEHDACGIGAVVDIKGRKSHQTVDDALRRAGARRGIDYELSVAPYDEPGRLVRL